MFEALSTRLEAAFSRLRNRGHLTEEDINEAMGEVRAALLEADVNVRVARRFVDRVRERLVGEELSRSLTPGQQVIKAVNDQLVEALGGESLRITYASSPPTVVLLAGLQGSGKTTTSAKLASWFASQGRNPMLVGADLQRPAAVQQLEVLGVQARVPVFSKPTDPIQVAAESRNEARRLGRDVVIVDTAGRLAIDEVLMEEIRQVSAAIKPDYTFLVVDAMTGQDAVNVATAFHESLELDGVILTKLDGDARGGAALSVKEIVGRPIAFASTGEHLRDFDMFYPDRMASRILGMGDVLSLIEQAERTFDREQAEKAARGMLEGRFTLEDFLGQLQQVRKMGPLSGLLSMLPGVPKEIRQSKDLIDDSHISRIEAIIRSMTPDERNRPEVLDGSRRSRVAKGAGVTVQEVNQLVKQFKEAQQLIKSPSLLGGLLGKGAGMGQLQSMLEGGQLASGLSDMGAADSGLGGAGGAGGASGALGVRTSGIPGDGVEALGLGGLFGGDGSDDGSMYQAIRQGPSPRTKNKKGGKGSRGRGNGRVTPRKKKR
ncbi:MAG: signal recognition particle protein [Actinobacteria bacterium]|nr:signal recognition particle protein [Actinomycetota bacterium]MCL5886558.1 signal recognition particle protein [Actinomycetota bacterium]